MRILARLEPEDKSSPGSRCEDNDRQTGMESGNRFGFDLLCPQGLRDAQQILWTNANAASAWAIYVGYQENGNGQRDW